MFKLLKYCKPYLISILLIFVMIFIQVQAELALPDYMSQIVTEGVQYGGITDEVPEAITSDNMNKLLLLADEAQDEIILESYTYIEQGDESYLAIYPELENQSIYLLKEETVELNQLITPLLSIKYMLSSSDTLSMLGIPEGTDIWQMLAINPDALSQISSQSESLTADIDTSTIALMAVKAEYDALKMDTGVIQTDYILNRGLIMLTISLFSVIVTIIGTFLSSRTAAKIARDIRLDVFSKVESFSSSEFSKFSTSSLITRSNTDVQQIQTVLTMTFRIVMYAPLMGIGALIKVFNYPSMLWILGFILVFIISLMVFVFTQALPRFSKIQKLVDKLTLIMRENLDGMLVVRAFNTQNYEEKRFNETNTDLTKINLFVNRLTACISPVMTFLMSSVSILIVWVGGHQIDLGNMDIGSMLAFMQYALLVLMSFMMVAMIFIIIPRASVSAVRINEVLETQLTILDPSNPQQVPVENQVLSFNHVSFKYPLAEENVLTDIHFTAKPGETIAIIGGTGSGKSTLINLIPRFFDVSEGSITYGDINIKDYDQHDLRDKIGYVPQKGILFSGTIESNLQYADEHATKQTLVNVLQVSQSEEFVSAMPQGELSPIAQGGTNVSGGQKQRLSIARALVKKPNILIFDDSFSALDFKTDATLRKELSQFLKETKSTLFIVAQRINTILNADKIIVLEDGKMVGFGNHETLLKSCEVYQEIAYSQLSKEELENV